MKKRAFFGRLSFLILLAAILIPIGYWKYTTYIDLQEQIAREATGIHTMLAIDDIITARLDQHTTSTDPFGDDGTVNILMIGLDTRAGTNVSHCDVIQMLHIDINEQTAELTALPRGTYSPLPPGTANTSSDYYVSKSCELGGIEYGVTQMERILGMKADYLAFVGFSEAIGIFRALKLPTTDTMQWLRQRQGYAIGEPQRAHNHSTFIKQMMVKFVPEEKQTQLDKAFEYVIYNMINTDLSFNQVTQIVDAFIDMDIKNNPDKISLAMKPSYIVQEVAYDPENAAAYVESMIGPVSRYLSPDDYQELTEEDIDRNILNLIEEKQGDDEFTTWAYEHQLWLQISEEYTRHSVQFDILTKHSEMLDTVEAEQALWSDYILEMEYLQQGHWIAEGRAKLEAIQS